MVPIVNKGLQPLVKPARWHDGKEINPTHATKLWTHPTDVYG
jgi:hypothetical protein